MQRFPYDLSHYVGQVGELGRLQTLSVIPVCANDTISLDFTGALRLSPLRKPLSLDARVDVVSFFVPHRHIYGDDWVNAIKEGSKTTFSTTQIPAEVGRNLGYLPSSAWGAASALPADHMVAGYARIYNEYFRVPNVDEESDFMPEDELPTEEAILDYGKTVARLPTVLTTCPKNYVPQSEYTVDASDSFSLTDIKQVAQNFKNEVTRSWFAERYRDVMAATFGSAQVNTDADQRPTLLARTKTWMSGYDVDGTSDANLGDYAGKSQVMLSHKLMPKHFKEHGNLFTLMVVRFPPIFNHEHNPLLNGSRAYDYFSGDPDITKSNVPNVVLGSDWIGNITDGGITMGQMPYSHPYRACPNFVHPRYDDIPGYPFVRIPPGTTDLNRYLTYEHPEDYAIFSNNEMAHWNLVSKFNVEAKRIIPPASSSIYSPSDHLI